MFKITFLGTSAMVPTKTRSHSAIFINYDNIGMLFDCGEGTQRQLKIAEIKPSAIRFIILTHLEGDHVLGLPGLIQTMAMSEYNEELKIIGPKGLKKMMEHLLKAFPFYTPIKFSIAEIKQGKIVDTDRIEVIAHPVEHKVPCFGFEIIEKDRIKINLEKAKKLKIPEGPLMGELSRGKNITIDGKKIDYKDATFVVEGKKIGISGDTRLCNSLFQIAKDKDAFICEATFSSKHEDNARDYFHMTSGQAAMVASQAGAKRLFLTHVSQRYKDLSELEKEAKDIFPDSQLAHDFLSIKL